MYMQTSLYIKSETSCDRSADRTLVNLRSFLETLVTTIMKESFEVNGKEIYHLSFVADRYAI
jgi:hypothetical protein